MLLFRYTYLLLLHLILPTYCLRILRPGPLTQVIRNPLPSQQSLPSDSRRIQRDPSGYLSFAEATTSSKNLENKQQPFQDKDADSLATTRDSIGHEHPTNDLTRKPLEDDWEYHLSECWRRQTCNECLNTRTTGSSQRQDNKQIQCGWCGSVRLTYRFSSSRPSLLPQKISYTSHSQIKNIPNACTCTLRSLLSTLNQLATFSDPTNPSRPSS